MRFSLCGSYELYLFFFFKQKTSYEMRISDWSSDVCSSDLRRTQARRSAMPGADHGGDGLCGPRGRGTHPRGGRRRLCLEADFADALRRRGQRARRPGGITKPRSAVRALAALFESGPRPCRAQNKPLRADYLILASLNSTCLRTTGSYLRKLSFSVWLRGFFLVT